MSDNEEENKREERDVDRAAGHRLVLPDDGYEWRKYGQKFIQNIGKFRSYFRCHRQNCKAKKRVEWSSRSEADDVRVVYERVHSHPSSQAESSSGNQYNLYTQVFGNQPPSISPQPRTNPSS
ncbi:hypothetical protein Tsubulata_018731 [Turnera subulata]|uniref:WRKY domain-containing protein n=1 Tax=Turnera subulata TaxID=218843 RepID=A0A9Q0JH20_9ROSI|nr:hypothetical protein Tsubulata_018731 [Turnera subulata]